MQMTASGSISVLDGLKLKGRYAVIPVQSPVKTNLVQ